MLLRERISKFDLLMQVIKDPESKPLHLIIKEHIILYFYYKSYPKHYFARYLFKKAKTNIKDYYPNKYLYKNFKPKLNNLTLRHYVEDKLFFNLFYTRFSIPMPQIFMYNYKTRFVQGSLGFDINTSEEFSHIVSDIFEKHPVESIFIKPFYGTYGGDRVYKLMKSQISSDPEYLSHLYDKVLNRGFIFQETIDQHPVMNKLNPTSVNTIRFETFINKEGLVKIVSAYLRISMGDKYVDNISSGGCQVAIDLENGKLDELAYSKFNTAGVKVFTTHPKTNVAFGGFQIPFFTEAKELIIKTAAIMPGLRLVGWDVAISKDGPMLIEGNSDYDMSGSDLSENGYRKNSVFQEILKEVGEN